LGPNASVQISDRDGEIIDIPGIDTKDFARNPIMFWNHLKDEPIGRWSQVSIQGNKLRALGEFAPEGVSPLADKICALLKNGFVNAISIGGIPRKGEPIKGGGGFRITQFELCEMSLCGVPANPEALVTERSLSKAGRVLSGANADKLRQAHDAAESCRALVADVLDGAGGDTEGQAKRLRELEYLKLKVAPRHRCDRMHEVRMIELDHLQRFSS